MAPKVWKPKARQPAKPPPAKAGAGPATAPAPAPAKPPAPAKKGILQKIPSKFKMWCIFTLAIVFFIVFVIATVFYLQLFLAERNPAENKLHNLRKSVAKGLKSEKLEHENYVVVAHDVVQLPKYITDSNKDYNERKAKYQTIFKKGKLRSAETWQIFERNIYYLSNTEKTWFDADNYCKTRDSNLVSILSEKEQFFVSNLLTRPAWIGLTDENVEGHWVWSDGSLVLMKFWTHGHPRTRASGTNMDCAFISPSLGRNNWNDTDCFELKRWVCKESLDIEGLSLFPNPFHTETIMS